MIKRLPFLIALAVAMAWCLRAFLFDTVSVASGSMEPTLTVGNHYLVNKFVYRLHAPERGDIIVFINPVDEDTGYIKRVIAIGGDTIELRDKHVILNGKALEEPYTVYKRAKEHLEGDNLGPMQVPEDDVFVLGDDRDVSYDSTSWKDPKTGQHIYFLPLKNIKGKLIDPI